MSAGGLTAAFRGTDLRSLFATIRGIPAPATLLIIVPLIGFEYVLRSLRWRTLLAPRRETTWRALFPITAGGFFLNNVLPFRAGEVARVYWTSRRTQVPVSTVIAVLAADRLFDMMCLLTFAGLVVLWKPALLPSPAAVGLFVAATAGGFLFLTSLAVWADAWKRLLQRPGVPPLAVRWIGQFIEGTESLHRLRTVVFLYALSLVFWVADAFYLGLVGTLFDLPLGWGGSLWTILAFCAGALLPSAPGYIGTLDAAGVAALGYLGFGRAQALPFILTAHACQILVTAVWGIPALFLLGGRRGDDRATGDRPFAPATAGEAPR